MKFFKLTAMSVAVLALLSSSTCSKQETAAPGQAPATEKTSSKMEKKEFTPEFLTISWAAWVVRKCRPTVRKSSMA